MSEKLMCPYCGSDETTIRLHDDHAECETYWCKNRECSQIWWYERGSMIARIRLLERENAELREACSAPDSARIKALTGELSRDAYAGFMHPDASERVVQAVRMIHHQERLLDKYRDRISALRERVAGLEPVRSELITLAAEILTSAEGPSWIAEDHKQKSYSAARVAGFASALKEQRRKWAIKIRNCADHIMVEARAAYVAPVRVEDRLPTEDDADEHGEVLWRRPEPRGGYGWGADKWNALPVLKQMQTGKIVATYTEFEPPIQTDATHWMRCPRIDSNPPEPTS